MSSAVIVSIRVAASPERAFEAFTRDIGRWWRSNPLFRLTPHGDGELHFEPGPEGRLLASLPDGSQFEVGRVLAWEPGRRLRLDWRQASFGPEEATQVEVRFESVGAETRVTVEHGGWDRFAPAHAARHGMALMLFQRRAAEHWQAALGAMRALVAGSGPVGGND